MGKKLAAIIKLPPNPGVDVAYADLPCKEEDIEKIKEIITTVAGESKFSLLLNQNHLESLGEQIKHVHPFKFLAVAVSSNHLKNCLALIFDDYFKKDRFMGDLGQSLTREATKKKLELYLPHFAAEIGIPVESIHSYIQSHDWEGLVKFLMR
jgi:hypothetical protein